MPIHQGGLGSRWVDAQGPSFGAALGAAPPSEAVLSPGAGGDTTMDVFALVYNENTQDREYFSSQINHDIYVPNSGTISFYPHVHFTFVSEPADGQTVIWKISYVYAKEGSQFQDAAAILTCGTYTTTGAAEVRKHLIAYPAAPVTIAAADAAPSMIIQYSVKLDTASTISNGTVALLFCDWHYQAGPVGTIDQY